MANDALDYITGIGGLVAGGANLLMQNQASQTNIQLARENRDFMYEQWKRENAYNDPSAQMARLQRAGLNPNLMYGEGAGSLPASASMPVVDQGRVVAPQIDPLTLAQIRNINADTEKKEIETEDTRVHADWQRGQIKVGETVVMYNKALTSMTGAQQKLIEGQTDMLATQTEKANSEIAKNYAEIQNMTIQQQQRFMELTLKEREVDVSCAKMAAETGYTLEQTKYVAALAMAKVYNLRSETALNKARENLTNKQALECEQAIENMKVQNGQMSWNLEMDKKYEESERELKIKQTAADVVSSIANASKHSIAYGLISGYRSEDYDAYMSDVNHLSK